MKPHKATGKPACASRSLPATKDKVLAGIKRRG